MSRGALIVLEGCDRAGKSTQCRRLVEALLEKGVRAHLLKFPGTYSNSRCILGSIGQWPVFTLPSDRTTTIGHQIDAYLGCKEELEDHSIHLLFSANRWELV